MIKSKRVASVLAYHTRTKHVFKRYAAGPSNLDWDAQPKAFREWAGAKQIRLPHAIEVADSGAEQPADLYQAMQFNLASIGSLLRLSVGLTAWKEYAGSRWSLRAHPSSGNLHPTETWLISAGVDGLEDGLYHYHNLHHVLEKRAWGGDTEPRGMWMGFSSIHWREAWKYGERAFRYCHLDMGHVLAAVSYAAALHGWRTGILNLETDDVAKYLGVDRESEFAGVESEEAEVIFTFQPCNDVNQLVFHWPQWAGQPSQLDECHMYEWPVIEEVAEATRGCPPELSDALGGSGESTHQFAGTLPTPKVILQRRSAQAFDGLSIMPKNIFNRILEATLPSGSPVWDTWSRRPQVHLVMMIHRVEGMPPGLYLLPRNISGATVLRQAFRDTFVWESASGDVPLYQLVGARAGKTARTLSCYQDIAAQSAVTFMMVATFREPIESDPASYRHLHWEAGMLGHVITITAEAAGWRGTGIGCFFDDGDHEVLGLQDDRFQVIYHYAVGMALDDPRILTLPAYS